MSAMIIPFNRASIVGREMEYIGQAVNSGVLSGEGDFVQRCEIFLENLLANNGTVLLTPSCTAALEMSAMLLNLGGKDEIIVPSFTFVSSALAFALRGAIPVFADVDPQTLNVSPKEIEGLITKNTKAIVIVHYGGVGCDMDYIGNISAKTEIPVIEDAAHALLANYKGQVLGSFGSFATFSFHETKNVTCGHGGALVVNDRRFVDRAYIIRDKGTNRRSFNRGDVPFYHWVDLGSSYSISNISAAFLFAQLENINDITETRRKIFSHYHSMLLELEIKGFLSIQSNNGLSDSSAHLFYILLESEQVRTDLQLHLRKNGIAAVFHYQPLHQSTFITETYGKQRELPITEDLAFRLLRLPLFYSLTSNEVSFICDSIADFFGVNL